MNSDIPYFTASIGYLNAWDVSGIDVDGICEARRRADTDKSYSAFTIRVSAGHCADHVDNICEGGVSLDLFAQPHAPGDPPLLTLTLDPDSLPMLGDFLTFLARYPCNR
jgi:hypothetical protein